GLHIQAVFRLQVLGAADVEDQVAAGLEMLLAADLLETPLLRDEMAIGEDELTALGLDDEVEIFLSMKEDLFRSFLVLEAQLVEPSAAFRAERLERGFRLVVRQVVGRHLIAVVDAAGDDREIGVAFEEADDHFLSDPRQEERAPALAGPVLRDADPARAVLV